jgi:hypothetical protein
MRKMMMIGVAFAAALALCGESAFAVDQKIIGKKLLIKNPPSGTANNKVVFLSKDPVIAIPGTMAEDPRCVPAGGSGAGGVLIVNDPVTSESFTINLPCGLWTINGAGNLYKYKDTTGATCKIVMVKSTKLVKAVCKGTQVSYDLDLGTDQVNVDVKLRTGTTPRAWCTSFNAGAAGCTVTKNGSDDKTYLAKNCTTAPVTCTASPSGAFIEVASLF